MKSLENPQSKLTEQTLLKIREAFIANLEELFTNSRWLSGGYDEEILDNLKKGGKVPAGGYLEDILIGTAVRIAKIYSDEDFTRLKEEFVK